MLDAQFLVLASDLGKEKAKQLRSDLNSFDMLRYVETLVSSKLQNLNKKYFPCHIVYNYLLCLDLYANAFHFLFPFWGEPGAGGVCLRFLQTDLTKLNAEDDSEVDGRALWRNLGWQLRGLKIC